MKSKNPGLETVYKYLSEHFQMVLATNGDHPWICTVYYSLDDELNLYFLTGPKTIHARHIAANPLVSVAVADSPQNPKKNKSGIQLYGKCEKISGARKVTHAIMLWKKSLGVTNPDYSYEGMVKKAISGRMYKITPKMIKYFNEDLGEAGEEAVFEL